MITAEQIAELYELRYTERHPVLSAMFEIRDIVNGDVVIPLPEMDDAEKPMVANLIGEGIDQTAMRVASTMPNLIMPALDPRKETGARSLEYANIRREAVDGWLEFSNLRRQHRQKARHLVGYGTSVIELKPDFKNHVPLWQVHDPLTAFPSARSHTDHGLLEDVVFAFKKPYAWIKARYPEQLHQVFKGRDFDELADHASTLFVMLKYVSAEQVSLVLKGAEKQGDGSYDEEVFASAVMCETYENPAKMCTVIMPERITLDRLMGQFNQTLGIYLGQSKLAALDLIATTKSVFPDMAILGREGQAPQLLGEEWKSGMTGEMNELMNADVQVLQLQPGYKTGEALDRLERSMRLYGVAPQFGGENPVNIRTGRAAEVAMSAQVDFRIQEYQEIMADSLHREIEVAIKLSKGWFGNRQLPFVVGTETKDYRPNTHFETTLNRVVYPMPGADVNGLLLGINNRVAIGTMSQRTARFLDPMIERPEEEGDRVIAERLDAAMLASLEQMAVGGMLPPADVAGIERKVFAQNMPLAEAIIKQQEEAQNRQAEQVPAGAPEAQAGIAVPGSGAESGVIPEPTSDMQRLNQLMQNMRVPQSAAGGAPQPLVAPAGA